jgi:hypothetical protein
LKIIGAIIEKTPKKAIFYKKPRKLLQKKGFVIRSVYILFSSFYELTFYCGGALKTRTILTKYTHGTEQESMVEDSICSIH